MIFRVYKGSTMMSLRRITPWSFVYFIGGAYTQRVLIIRELKKSKRSGNKFTSNYNNCGRIILYCGDNGNYGTSF